MIGAMRPAPVLRSVLALLLAWAAGPGWAVGARAGGAPVWVATTRVTFWGALAMALTAGIGMLVGTAV